MSTTLTVAGTDIIDDVLIADSTWQSAVNGAVGSCAFVVKDDGHTHSFTTGQEIILTVSGTKIWGGYVVRASRTFPLPVVDTSSVTTADRYWSIEGVDYNILFDKRVVRDTSDLNKVFSYAAGTYDDTIINDIYDNYLDVSGDGLTTSITRVGIAIFDIAGVTKGGTTSGLGNVAAQGYTWRQVMFSIVRNTGGIYFISPDKVFTYCDVETPSSPYVLTDTPATTTSGVGYRELEVLDDGSDLRNDVIVWGAGLGSQQIVSSRVQDATSIATHGTWQLGDFNGGIYKQATADTMASIYVNGSPTSKRGGKNDKVVFTATVRQPLFQVGQKVQVVNNVYGYSDTLPIRTMETKFVSKDEALFTLQCSFEVDAPWSMFDFFPFNNDGIGGFHFPIFPPPPGIGMTGGSSGVGDCFILDLFQRTVAAGGWGTSDSGLAWSAIFPSELSVDGHQGLVTTGAGNNGMFAGVDSTGPWNDAAFTFVVLVNFPLGSGVRVATEDAGGAVGTLLVELSSSPSQTMFLLEDGASNQTTTSPPITSGWAFIKGHYQQGGTIDARAWLPGTFEPSSYALTLTAVTPANPQTQTVLTSFLSSSTATAFGLVLYNMTVIDSFKTRTTSPGTMTVPDFGSDAVTSFGSNCLGTGYVSGGRGILHFTTPSSGAYTCPSETYQHTSQPGPWGLQDTFLMTTDFILTSSAGGAPDSGVTFTVKNNANAFSQYIHVDYANQRLIDPQGNTASVTLAYGTRYRLSWQIDHVSGTASASVWPDGGTKPSAFQVTGSLGSFTKDSTSDFIYGPDVALSAGSGVTFTATFGPILSCDSPPASDTGFLAGYTGFMCEIATDTGDHLTYQLSNAFQLGTTEVWDNGMLQTNGAVGSLVNDYAEEDPASGRITFFTARTSDDVIKVCYQAVGAHT